MGKRKFSNETFYVAKRIGKAGHEYEMIRDKDRVMVALSGGVTSRILLEALSVRLRRIPISYELFPVHVPDGVFGDREEVAADLSAFCKELELPLTILESASPDEHYRDIPHAELLKQAALRQKVHVVALGHDAFDIAAWVLSSMGRRGVLDVLHPAILLEGWGGAKVVRPLSFLTPDHIQAMADIEEIRAPKRLIPHPNADFRQVCDTFLRKKRGPLIEQLRNVAISATTIRTDYLV